MIPESIVLSNKCVRREDGSWGHRSRSWCVKSSSQMSIYKELLTLFNLMDLCELNSHHTLR